IARIRFAPQAGERRSRISEGIYADAEPCHRVTSQNADYAEDQDDNDAIDFQTLKEAKIENDRDADEDLEDHKEPSLRLQIGFASLVYQLGDFSHRRVNRQVAQLPIDHQTENHAQQGDEQPAHQ